MPRPFAAHIPPRKPSFARTTQKFWHHGCPYSTYHFNALSLLTPIFENMVIASIRTKHKQIKDKQLKLEVNSLILQEANHSNAFVQFNQQMIEPYYGQTLMTGRLKWFRAVINVLPQSFQLAASAFGEHLATVSSEFLLEDERWLEGVDEPIKAIWRWHSIEEIEHKHVAFDVYKQFHCNYFIRTATMGLFLGLFLLQYFSIIRRMMKQDKASLMGYFKLMGLYWIRPGYFAKFIWPFITYLKPFFHPNQRQNLPIAQKWRPILVDFTTR